MSADWYHMRDRYCFLPVLSAESIYSIYFFISSLKLSRCAIKRAVIYSLIFFAFCSYSFLISSRLALICAFYSSCRPVIFFICSYLLIISRMFRMFVSLYLSNSTMFSYLKVVLLRRLMNSIRDIADRISSWVTLRRPMSSENYLKLLWKRSSSSKCYDRFIAF